MKMSSVSNAPVSAQSPAISVSDQRRKHFIGLAIPAVRLLVLALMFLVFGVVQSSSAQSVIGSTFGAFIFSVAGVAFWVGYQGLYDAYSSTIEKFSVNKNDEGKDDAMLAVITDSRVVDELFVEYRIDVSADKRMWFVWRRYSDFYRVFKQESASAKARSRDLPSKRWFESHLSATFIEERKVQLNEYIQVILAEHGARRLDSAMADFFGM